jgi:hypothetical protein
MPRDQNLWLDWNSLVKRAIARFARGNIAVQEGRILFPDEQDRERAHVRVFTRRWKVRARGGRVR